MAASQFITGQVTEKGRFTKGDPLTAYLKPVVGKSTVKPQPTEGVDGTGSWEQFNLLDGEVAF